MRVDFIFYDSVASINGEAAGDRIGPRSTAVAFQDFRFRNRHRIADIVARAVNRPKHRISIQRCPSIQWHWQP